MSTRPRSRPAGRRRLRLLRPHDRRALRQRARPPGAGARAPAPPRWERLPRAQAETGIEVHKYGAHLFHTSNEKVWGTSTASRRSPTTSTVSSAIPGPGLYSAAHEPGVDQPVLRQEPHSRRGARPIAEQGERDPDRGRHEPRGEGDQPDRSPCLTRPHQGLHRQAVADRPDATERGHHHPAAGPLHVRQPVLQRHHEGLPTDGYTAWLERMADHPNIEVRLGDRLTDVVDEFQGKVPIVYTGPVDEYFGNSEGRLSAPSTSRRRSRTSTTSRGPGRELQRPGRAVHPHHRVPALPPRAHAPAGQDRHRPRVPGSPRTTTSRTTRSTPPRTARSCCLPRAGEEGADGALRRSTPGPTSTSTCTWPSGSALSMFENKLRPYFEDDSSLDSGLTSRARRTRALEPGPSRQRLGDRGASHDSQGGRWSAGPGRPGSGRSPRTRCRSCRRSSRCPRRAGASRRRHAPAVGGADVTTAGHHAEGLAALVEVTEQQDRARCPRATAPRRSRAASPRPARRRCRRAARCWSGCGC